MRTRIASGEWQPGSLLPASPRLMHEYEVGRATVQTALAALRAEGLIDMEPGIGVRVRVQHERQVVPVPRGAYVDARMPTPAERAELDIPEGVPVQVVTVGGRVRGVYPSDRVRLSTS